MKKLFLLLMLPAISYAGPFLEVGLGYNIANQDQGCIVDYGTDSSGCSKNPLGVISLGYEYNDFSIQYDHMSSIKDVDIGLNVISIRYRFR